MPCRGSRSRAIGDARCLRLKAERYSDEPGSGAGIDSPIVSCKAAQMVIETIKTVAANLDVDDAGVAFYLSNCGIVALRLLI